MAGTKSNLTIIGNLTRDPDYKTLPSGTHLCEFAVAINKRWTDGEGNQAEKTIFVDCTAWGKNADNIAQRFKKGKSIFIIGELDMDEWEDKQTGQRRSKLKVVVKEWTFSGGKEDGESGSTQPRQQSRPAGNARQQPPKQGQRSPRDYEAEVNGGEVDDDQVPF